MLMGKYRISFSHARIHPHFLRGEGGRLGLDLSVLKPDGIDDHGSMVVALAVSVKGDPPATVGAPENLVVPHAGIGRSRCGHCLAFLKEVGGVVLYESTEQGIS